MVRQDIIWVIDDDDSIRFVLQRALEKEKGITLRRSQTLSLIFERALSTFTAAKEQ